MATPSSAKPVVLFDVNETLLDLAALDPLFARLFGSPEVRREWFAQVLQSGMVLTILEQYRDFSTVADHALSQVAERRGVKLTRDQRKALGQRMRSLPAHPDVFTGLERLANAGFRLAALTNSPPDTANAQLNHAGLVPFFERILTVDMAGRLKPHPSVYTAAAAEMGVATRETILAAAHGWDVAGAMHAGCLGAFIARPGQIPDPLFPAPHYHAPDVDALAKRLTAEGV